MKVVWTKEALDKLAEIEDFIAANSPARAKKFVLRLIDRGNSIAHFPKRGVLCLSYRYLKLGRFSRKAIALSIESSKCKLRY